MLPTVHKSLFLLAMWVGAGLMPALAQTAPAQKSGQGPPIKGNPISPQTLSTVLVTVNAFLDDLRTGDSAPGYDLLAPDAKKNESRDDWNSLVTQLHDKSGQRTDTQFAFALRTDHLPGAPNGEYIVVGLRSTFEKLSLVETVVLTAVGDRYLISGYHFQGADKNAKPQSDKG